MKSTRPFLPYDFEGQSKMNFLLVPLSFPLHEQGMGFDRAAVVQALQQTGNDSFTAVNMLVARGGGRGPAPGSNDAWGDGSGATTSAPPGRGSAFMSEAPHDHAS